MRRRFLAVMLTVSLCLSLFPVMAFAGSFSDMPQEGTWSYAALKSAVDNGLLLGSNGKLDPNGKLTRAQMAAIVTRAFGAAEQSDISSFTDVPAGSWYYDAIAKAVKMGIFQGGTDGKMNPDQNITREQAFAVLARALKLEDGDVSVLEQFSDGNMLSEYAAGPVAAMVASDYVHGNGGMLDPKGYITRAQFAVVMYNIISNYINADGTYSADLEGNAIVSIPGAVLQNMTIDGDLIVGEGVGDGELTLDGVTVTGRMLVRGGGEHSIIIKNSSSVGHIIVAKTGDNGVRIHTEEGCRVEVLTVNDGKTDVILDGTFNQVNIDSDVPVVLKDATITGLNINAEAAKVETSGNTSIVSAIIAKDAEGASFEVNDGAKIVDLKSDAENVAIEGNGKIESAAVSGNNTSIDVADAKVTVTGGASGVSQNGQSVSSGTAASGTGASSGGSGKGGGSKKGTRNVYSIADLTAALASDATVINLLPSAGDDSILFVDDDDYVITVSSGQTLNIGVPVIFRGEGSKLVNNGTVNIEYDYLEYVTLEEAWGWDNDGPAPDRDTLLEYFKYYTLYYRAGNKYKEVSGNVHTANSLYIQDGVRNIYIGDDEYYSASLWFDSNDSEFVNNGKVVNKADVWFSADSTFTNTGILDNYGSFGFNGYSDGVNDGTINNYADFSPVAFFRNNDTINNNSYMSLWVEFTNSADAVFNNSGDLYLEEGSLINNGTVNNSGSFGTWTSDSSQEPSSVVNNGTFINDGYCWLEEKTEFTNAGTFVNGSGAAGDGTFHIVGSSFTNTGKVTSNIHISLDDTDFIQTGSGFFENSGGMNIKGGKFDLSNAEEGSFVNTDYLQFEDCYGDGEEYSVCELKLGNKAFKNSSNRAYMMAYALSDDGYAAAVKVQKDKLSLLGPKDVNFNNLEAYDQIVISYPMNVTANTKFDAFDSYSIWGRWYNSDKPKDASITVSEGVTLTLADGCSLYVSENGKLINNGMIKSDDYSWITFDEVGGSYIAGPSASIDEEIDFEVRYAQNYEEAYAAMSQDEQDMFDVYGSVTSIKVGNVSFGRQGTITGLPDNADIYTSVYNLDGLKAALAGSQGFIPSEVRITTFRPFIDLYDVKVSLDSDLTIRENARLTVNNSVDFTIPYGKTLTVNGELMNDGDIHIYGNVIVNPDAHFRNWQNIDLGAVTGSEKALIDVKDDGRFYNDGNITVYGTGEIIITANSRFEDYGTISGWTCTLPNINQTYITAETINVNAPDSEITYRNCVFKETVTIQSDSSVQGEEAGEIRFYDCTFENGITVVNDGMHRYGVYFNGNSSVDVKATSAAAITVTSAAIGSGQNFNRCSPRINNIQGMTVQADAPCSLSADGAFEVNGLTVSGEYLGNGGIPWSFKVQFNIDRGKTEYGIGCCRKNGELVDISVSGTTDADIYTYKDYNQEDCEGNIDLSGLRTSGSFKKFSTKTNVIPPAEYSN